MDVHTLSPADNWGSSIHMTWLIVAGGVLAVVVPWLLGLLLQERPRQHIELPSGPRRAALVVAHPDDEAMFFWPTLLLLQERRVPTCVLCLSTGDAAGLGKVRTEEIRRSCARLAVAGADLVTLNVDDLRDGFHPWPEDVVAKHVLEFLGARRADLVLTFDDSGVSRHPNHVSTSRGVRRARDQLRCSARGDDADATHLADAFQLLMLDTVPLPAKYLGVLSLMVPQCAGKPTAILFSPIAAFKAMWVHWSQLVWYRILFVFFSRYSYINTYTEYKPRGG